MEKIGLLSTGMQPIRLPIGIGGMSAGLSSKGQQMVVNSAKTAFQTLKMAKGTPTGGETKGTSALGVETLAEGKTATPAAELLNESEISNDVKANTQAFSESLGGKQYQTQQGEVPTKENSSMAVMRTAPDGSISARNITKEANGDGWLDLSTGNRLSGADVVHGLTGVQGSIRMICSRPVTYWNNMRQESREKSVLTGHFRGRIPSLPQNSRRTMPVGGIRWWTAHPMKPHSRQRLPWVQTVWQCTMEGPT